MSIFEEQIEVELLKKFTLVQVIGFYSTFSEHEKEYSEMNSAVC